MVEEVRDPDQRVFVARPLPRSRAWLALIFLGAGLLSVGGAIEFATGSPMTEGQGVSSYFAALFGFHAVVFCGAALIGALPALAVPVVKAVWLLVCAALYGVAFWLWRSHPGARGLAEWLALSATYAPALLPLAAGCLWGNWAVRADGGDASPRPSDPS